MEEDNESAKREKPKLCDFLGVEVGEYFEFPKMDGPFFVNYKGELGYIDAENVKWNATYDMLTCIINHPESIIHLKQLTEEDIEDAKAIKRIFRNSTDVDNIEVMKKLNYIEIAYWLDRNNTHYAEHAETCFFSDILPSLTEGKIYHLSELVNGYVRECQ